MQSSNDNTAIETTNAPSSPEKATTTSTGGQTQPPPPPPPKSPSKVDTSPNSYSSQRSIHTYNNNVPQVPPQISHDQSSLNSIESDTKNSHNSTNGVVQGMDMLEKQQLKWEEARKKRAAAEQLQRQQQQQKMQQLQQQQQQQRQQQRQRQQQHNMGYYGHAFGIPQDQQFLHHNQSHYSGGGVPKTVHLSGDGDDVSESLMDEGMNNSLTKWNRKRDNNIKRNNSFGKFLKTPLKSTQNLRRNISDRFGSDPTLRSDNKNKNNLSSTANAIARNNNNNTIENTNNASNASNGSITTLKPILYGYLHKLGRNGKWQKRYFESDGTALLYYKNSKRTTILATLDLLYVGNIHLDSTDAAGCTFFIQVKGRNYYLCADTKEKAKDWVISLNRVKEARMQIGGLKLIDPSFEGSVGTSGGGDNDNMVLQNIDGDDPEDQVAARIVMVAARKRLKGLGKDDFGEMERSLDGHQNNPNDKTGLTSLPSAGTGSLPNSPNRLTNAANRASVNLISAGRVVQNNVKVRWTKRRSAMQNWTRRVSRWAKRLTMVRCIIKDDVVHFNEQLHMQYQQANEDPLNLGLRESEFQSHYQGQLEPSKDYGNQNFDFSGYPETNYPDELSNVASKESMENSNFQPTRPPNSRVSSWKSTQVHRMQEVTAKDECSGSSIQSSSGRLTPVDVDDGSDTCIT